MKKITAVELDEMFDNGDPLNEYISGKPYHFYYQPSETRSLSLSLPAWLVGVLDEEAERRGIARKALINTILVDWADGIESRQRGASSRLWPRADEDLPRSPDDAA